MAEPPPADRPLPGHAAAQPRQGTRRRGHPCRGRGPPCARLRPAIATAGSTRRPRRAPEGLRGSPRLVTRVRRRQEARTCCTLPSPALDWAAAIACPPAAARHAARGSRAVDDRDLGSNWYLAGNFHPAALALLVVALLGLWARHGGAVGTFGLAGLVLVGLGTLVVLAQFSWALLLARPDQRRLRPVRHGHRPPACCPASPLRCSGAGCWGRPGWRLASTWAARTLTSWSGRMPSSGSPASGLV